MEERGEKKRINTNIDHDVLRAMAWERLLKARKVHVKGKIMSLKTLYDSVEKKEVEKERGLCESKENAVTWKDCRQWESRREVSSERE